MTQPLKFRIQLLINLIRYALRIRPDATVAMLIGIFSSVLEVAGLTVLLPLTRIAANIPVLANSPWSRFAEFFGQPPTARFYVIAFFALLFLRTMTQLITTVLVNRVTRRLNAIFSTRALEAFVHHLHFSEVQRESIGHFVSVAGDEAVRGAMIVNSVIRLVPLLLLFLLYLAMISYQSWQTGAGFVAFCLFMVLVLFGAFRKVLELSASYQRQSGTVHTHFIESLSGLRTVRSFNAEAYVTDRYGSLISTYMHTLFLVDVLTTVGASIPTLVLTGAMLSAVTFFISPPQLIVILPIIMVGIMMVLRLLPLATQTLDVAMRLTSDLKAAENVFEMLEAVKSADESDLETLTKITQPVVSIEFDEVSFRYDESLPPVLDEFSVIMTAGRSYAISGPSGSGKSTIVDLLLKFYEPQQGTIRVNGQSIADVSNVSLRRRIVLAEQMTRVFYDTIEHNVQFGLPAYGDEVEKQLKAVGLQEFLQTLPAGRDTILNFQGSNVSGGQRQRIGLARALLRSGDVLILDESTSALDHALRKRILDQLLEDYSDKIIILIAHDPTILERVDEVIYLGRPAAAAIATVATD